MRHPIRCAVTLAHEGPERDGADFAAGGDGADGDAIGLAGDAPQRIAKTEVEEDAARIRRELETGAQSVKPVRRSMRVTRWPLRASASAVVNPPMPAPTTASVRPGTSSRHGDGVGHRPPTRIRRASPGRRRAWVVFEQRRAIGADHLVVASHVDEDMRMVEGRPGADAHEFLRAHVNRRHAGIVLEMRGALKAIVPARLGCRNLAAP